MADLPGGYMGRILRVDLTREQISVEPFDPALARRWVGGVGMGAHVLWEEVPAGVEWDDPENRLVFFSGPLGGTRVSCSGTYNVATRGPMTNLAGSSQANGFFGAFLKTAGFDGIIVQGQAPGWRYLHIHDGTAEIRDASHLLGQDTWATDDLIKQELGYKETLASVIGVGPAGEHRVRWALIAGDKGHVAAHNGVGAVMGAKRLKAICVGRGKQKVPVHDDARLGPAAKALFEGSFEWRNRVLNRYGTAGNVEEAERAGWLPVRNYTTSRFPAAHRLSGQYIRTAMKLTNAPCWACRMGHCHKIEITEGPYKGYQGEEPEYEGMAFGSTIYIHDTGSAIYLSDLTDRLGLDVNEAGWTVGWAMECYERGALSREELDGLDLTWGNAEAVAALLHRIARREGIGNLLAEGALRAAQQLGRGSIEWVVGTRKGGSPRGHDHRGRWSELLDTILTNTSTIESTFGGVAPEEYGLPPVTDRFDPIQVATANAITNGPRQWEDCLGVCRFCLRGVQWEIETFNCVTGLGWTLEDVFTCGRRIVNLLRAFNFRHGLTAEMEEPLPRYASAPTDGPCVGTHFGAHYPMMKRLYYRLMGWDEASGKPLPETLRALGLESAAAELWRGEQVPA